MAAAASTPTAHTACGTVAGQLVISEEQVNAVLVPVWSWALIISRDLFAHGDDEGGVVYCLTTVVTDI